jgi:hypothetical protein
MIAAAAIRLAAQTNVYSSSRSHAAPASPWDFFLLATKDRFSMSKSRTPADKN